MIGDIPVGAATFWIGAALLRSVGAALRVGGAPWVLRALAWVLCLLAGWLAAAAAGAWSPAWIALALAAIAVGSSWRRERRVLWLLTDALVVVLCAARSVPPLGLVPASLALGVWVGVGGILDFGLRRASRQWRALWVAGVCLVTGAIVFRGWQDETWTPLLAPPTLLFASLSPTPVGERIVLDTGAVAWLDPPLPSASAPIPAALSLHGNDAMGSNQSGAIALRRALRAAGLLVLSVDRIAYGESPPPARDAPVAAWDPLPSARAALAWLRARPEVGPIYVVGHSMGVVDALRLLAAEKGFSGAVYYGANLTLPMPDDERWLQRFHEKRRLRERLPTARVREILDLCYDKEDALAKLPDRGIRHWLVRFGIEWDDVREARDAFYERLPEPKEMLDLPTNTHYFSAHQAFGIVLGDTRATQELVAQLQHQILGGAGQ